ncbi:MAG TPA: OB-fold domain-containing protein [Candidatus Limnocylindria bacterium]
MNGAYETGILPALREDSREFWKYAQMHELRVQRCSSCRAFRWPPAPVCYVCRSFASHWVKTSGDGSLVSWVTYRRQYFVEFKPPYSVGLIELTEGPRYPSLLVGAVPDGGWRSGMRMRVTFRAVQDRGGDRMLLPVFEAARAAVP